jgi:asparagine synthase (glutamine-hydrolysing)
MCGILGILPADKEGHFRKALDTLSHRGPDDSGVWSSGRDITLGHRRLSILDLSPDGRQPMSYANGRYAIVFNGEIYNFLELRNELMQKGCSFKSQSDTEVILAAYCEWGKDCLLKFNGMWAFAIWDAGEKTLFLSRDRFGVKPLFYALIGRKFVFASEMKAIFPYLNEVKPSSEIQWLIQNMWNYETTDKCLVEGIKRFPAGHYGIYRDGSLALGRYWDTLNYVADAPVKYEDQVEHFRELFIDACKIRMRSDVPIGTALSGGLDSSATISTMAHIAKQYHGGDRISGDWQHAFVATFPGTPLDESYYARKVVDHIGIKATYLEVDPLRHWDRIEDYTYLVEELCITSPVPMIETYGAMRKNGVYVTIDGHGADELLAGYGEHILTALHDCGLSLSKFKSVTGAYRDLYADHGQFLKVGKNLHLQLYLEAIARKLIGMPYRYASNFVVLHLLRALRHPGYLLLVAKALAGRMTGKRTAAPGQQQRHGRYEDLDSFNKMLYVIFHETILPTLLRNYDRYSMINGVEIRMPFMDYRLVRYAFSLPWTSKTRDSYTKKIVRDAVATFMPHEVAYRKTKIGFNTPIVDWMKNQLKMYFLDEINSTAFRTCSLINPAKVKKEIETVISGSNVGYSAGEAAWVHFMPYLWEKSVIKRKRIRESDDTVVVRD